MTMPDHERRLLFFNSPAMIALSFELFEDALRASRYNLIELRKQRWWRKWALIFGLNDMVLSSLLRRDLRRSTALPRLFQGRGFAFL